MSTVRVEWIGVDVPTTDDRIAYRKIMGLYTNEEELLLEAVTKLLLPLVRQKGSTARRKTTRSGYGRDYTWGPRVYVVEMDEPDARRLFDHDPDQAEFRLFGAEEHHDRKPVVPWHYITKELNRLMEEARNGPAVVKKGERKAANDRQAMEILGQWRNDHIDKAKDYGVLLDPKTLKPVRT